MFGFGAPIPDLDLATAEALQGRVELELLRFATRIADRILHQRELQRRAPRFPLEAQALKNALEHAERWVGLEIAAFNQAYRLAKLFGFNVDPDFEHYLADEMRKKIGEETGKESA